MQTSETVQARCAECRWEGELPAVARCPECGSTQIGRADEMPEFGEEALRALFRLRVACQSGDEKRLASHRACLDADGPQMALARRFYEMSLYEVHSAAHMLLAVLEADLLNPPQTERG